MTAWFDRRATRYDVAEPTPAPTANYAAAARRYWSVLLLIVAAATIGTFLYSQLVLTRSPVFESATTIDVAPSSEEIGYANRFTKGSPVEAAEVVVQTYAEYVRSRPTASLVVREYLDREAQARGISRGELLAQLRRDALQPGLRRTLATLNSGAPPVRDPLEAVVDELVESTTVGTVNGTYLLRVTVQWDRPEVAAWFANRLSERLVEQANAKSRNPGARIGEEIEGRLANATATLNNSRETARRIKSSLGIVDLDRQRQSLIDERTAAETRLSDERAQIAALEAQVSALRRAAGGRLSASQVQVEQTLALEAPRLNGLKRSVGERSARIAQISAQLAALGAREQSIDKVEADILAQQAEVATLLERRNFAALDNIANRPQIRIIERAIPAAVRSSPKVLLNTALGGVAGLALAGLFLMAAAALYRPRTAVSDIHRIFTPVQPEGAVFGQRLYAGILGRPARGKLYSADESRAIGARLDTWLSEPLRAIGKPLYVVATGPDRDSLLLVSLLDGHLRRKGEATDPIDARGGVLPPLGEQSQGRPLICCGGLRENGTLDVLSQVPGAVAIVYRPAEQRAQDLESLRADIVARTGEEPFAIALDA
jgi:uncharacterized protein involved in exopolysaccharide biosynthesis